MTTHTFPSQAELRMIERAAAHAVAESALPERARFRNGVTDLDVARVMRALEAGRMVVQPRGLNYHWVAPSIAMGQPGKLNAVVREMIRTGLAVNRGGRLFTARVHLCGEESRTACWPTMTLRVRVHDDPAMVDCPACLDRL